MRDVREFGPAPIDVPDAYPGSWPDGVVVVDDGHVRAVAGPPPTDGLRPIVAFGSNACPAQLHRKALGGPVLLTPTTLRNHVVVHAAHLTTYGAVPATVTRWPGAISRVFVTWLTAAQHHVMDLSEGGNYERVLLPTDAGVMPAYRARSGLLRRHGTPLRIPGVAAVGAGLPPVVDQPTARALLTGRG